MKKHRSDYLTEERPVRETPEAKRRRRKKMQQFFEQIDAFFGGMSDEDQQILFSNAMQETGHDTATETIIHIEATAAEEEIEIIPDENEQHETDPSLIIEEEEQPPQLWLPGMVLTEIRDGIPVITSSTYSEAFAEAGNYLVPGAGQTFIWRHPKKKGGFAEKISGYAFSTPAAWWNHTNLSKQDRATILTELLSCTSDQYHHDIVEKASDQEPYNNEDFVAMVYAAQKLVYATDQTKWTGKYDSATRTAVQAENTKVATSKANEKKYADKAATQSGMPQFKLPGKSGDSSGVAYSTVKFMLEALPFNWLVDAFVKQLDQMDDKEFQKNARANYLLMASYYRKAEPAPDWAATWLAPLHLFWPLMDGVNYGYYSALYEKSESVNMKAVAKNLITSITDPDYYFGTLAGILPGIGQWFVDLKDMVVMLLELPGQLFSWIGSLPEKAKSAGDFLSKQKGDVIKLFADLVSNPKMASEVFDSFKSSINTAMTQGLHSAGEKAGKWLGESLMSYALKSHYEMGQMAGAVIGYVIPEILLMVFSEGIGTVLKSSAKFAEYLLQSFRLGRAVLEGASLMKTFFRAFLGMLRGLGKKFGQMAGKTLDNLVDFFEGIQKHLGLSDEVGELAAKAETKVDDAGKLTGEATEAATKERRPEYAKNADEATETKAKKEAETEIDKNDPDFASKQQALIQAKIITEAADLKDLMPPALMLDLAYLKSFKGVKGFDFDPKSETTFQIGMLGSYHNIKGNYTVDKVPSGKINASAKGEIDGLERDAAKNGVDTSTSEYKAKKRKLEAAVENFPTQTIKIGPYSFQIDSKMMAHILGRHHPDYFISFEKKAQSFFPKSTSVDDIMGIFRALENKGLGNNRLVEALNKTAGTGKMKSFVFKLEERFYQLGFNDKTHNIGQFFIYDNALVTSEIKINAVEL